MRGMAEWLASIGLGEYAQRFAENAIDLAVLRDLTEHSRSSESCWMDAYTPRAPASC